MTKAQETALNTSLNKFGYVYDIVVDKNTMLIADGEHRLNELQKQGETEIEVILFDFKDEVERRMFRQVANKLRGEHDQELDKEEFKFFIDEGVFEDLEALLGEKQTEILRLLEGGEEEDDNVEELLNQKPTPRIKQGEVWQLGEHRLLCGDSTDPKNWELLMQGEKAHMILTDPPYNLAFNSTSKGKFEVFANDDLDDDTFKQVITDAAKNAHDHLQPTASIYYCIDWRSYDTLKRILQDLYDLKACIVWVKEFGGLGWHYRFRHELIIYGTHGPDPIFNTQGTAEDVWEIKNTTSPGPTFTLSNQGVYLETPAGQYIRLSKIDEPTKRAKLIKYEPPSITFNTTQDESTDVWEISSLNSFQSRNRTDFPGFDHPTIKPQNLLTRAIKNSTYPGHTIIDGFGGSGSTLIACQKTNRKARLIELDPNYCEVTIRRWENLTGQKATKTTPTQP
jgi:DNA modification methylase